MKTPTALEGKTILITSHSYAAFGGAELNAVELAEQLIEFGMKPSFFSYDIDGPLRQFIEKKFDTTIFSDQINKLSESDDLDELGVTRFAIEAFDYIWVGGNTIPISILKQIPSATKLPRFIFVHMSALTAFPLDAPLMPEFESSIASKILSISKKATAGNILRILDASTAIEYWPNPVPKAFSRLKKRSGTLEKIAVISSSHPGDEVVAIKDILQAKNIKVDLIGSFNNNVKTVDAAFYDEYDLVLGIGKNAKYSLVSGVPIYIYGRFGGGGYITEENIELNDAENFSGRGFGKKDTKTIAKEIVEGYRAALQFHEEHRETFIRELSIDNAASELFTELESQPPKKVDISVQEINWLISMQINLMQRHMRTVWLRRAEAKIAKLEPELERLTKDNAMFREDTVVLKAKRDELQRQIRDIYASHSWKLTKPIRWCGAVLKSIKNTGAEK